MKYGNLKIIVIILKIMCILPWLLKLKMINIWISIRFKCDALRDLVQFVQFKKYEKHPWMSVTFIKLYLVTCS